MDVLLSVGTAYPELVGAAAGEPLLDVRIVAADREPFRSIPAGVVIEPHESFSSIHSADVVIVSDVNMPIDTPLEGQYSEEMDYLRSVHAKGALVGSVCTASVLLAETGLLDGRKCAGHWAYKELFRSAYPKVTFVVGSILCLDHEGDGIVTAGSSSAWQDMALYVIARLCGREHAVRAAKVFLLADHGDGQLPFAMINRHIQTDDADVARCQRWIGENYRVANPVGAMIEHSGLNRRTFVRRFRTATGYSPLEYVHRLRVEEAKQIIEEEHANVSEVGYAVGYDDLAFFRRLFKRQTGLAPAAYRRKFASILGYRNSAS
jgi:transcriptional regulator GlxA family with amidase domain